jgi:DNA polymerase-3 subunit epsilon/ATP-dependent DNA helicase DinG
MTQSVSPLWPRQEETCVSLDLETTGINPDSDEIIEVGAVKFQGDRVLDTFQTLVNPYRPLPQFIRELTGITQLQVDEASAFASVAPGLESFIGDCPIVGQNIAFDIEFLLKKGMPLSNPRYDTREMASIFLPKLREYALASLAASLGIQHPRPHRAVPDAEVTFRVFDALKGVALDMDEAVLLEIYSLHSRAQTHLAQLILRLQGAVSQRRVAIPPAVAPAVPEKVPATEHTAALPSVAQVTPFDEEEDAIAGFFQEDGPLAQVMDSYRYRPQQVEMALAVAQAMEQSKHLVVEGGTGVGKSMAYLLPAALFAQAKGARVVVSTNTINLQEQLISKDLPTLCGALAEWSPQLGDTSFALLKGRDNYLCLRRLGYLRGEATISSEEANLASKVLVWLQTTSSGDRAEMNMTPRDAAQWSRISAAECPDWRERGCFLRAARAKAEASDIVVVNHALLMRDLAEGTGSIPDYDYLIVDEAHHLEEEATRQFGWRLSQGIMEQSLERLEGSRGLYGALRVALGQLFASPRAAVLEPLAADGESLLPRARERVSELWAALAGFLGHHHEEGDARQLTLQITRGSRAQPDWSELEVAWENADLALADLYRNLERVSVGLSGLDETHVAGLDTLVMEVSSSTGDIGEVRERLRSFVAQPEDNRIYWMTQDNRAGEIALNAAPLEVGELLQERLFSQKESVVLTSATMSTQGNFRHISERLGLEDVDELLVDSPFDYPKSVLLCLPGDMPDPNNGGYRGALQQALMDICRAAGGRTMGLFTSHASLQATRSGIKDSLEGDGFRVLAQGVDGPPRALLETFLKEPKSVLLGTASFWEGVDIPGGALKALVVARLPFNVPTEPVFAARSQLFEDPFNQYAVPQSVLRFRQGFGRLIRGEEDRGVVVVLDQRIISRRYGRVFLDSIPECTVSKGSLRELSREVERWLAVAP